MRLMILGVSKMIKELIIIFVLIGTGISVSDKVISLSECTNPNDKMDLQQLLNSYHYTMQRDDYNFNCVEFTIACNQFLLKNGYNTAIMAHWMNETSGHCYPIVKFKSGWVAVEASLSVTSDSKIGLIFPKGGNFNYLTGIFINDSVELREYDNKTSDSGSIYAGDLSRYIVKNN